ncbi:hypothetical protein TWF694_001522 [Orbilia ellipsospora]|uniref:Macro domain-containing protein n=1 Tax=Orbilia ellipsospora TaxID=2528407 RepID=A0AAV9XTB0_9PEZI
MTCRPVELLNAPGVGIDLTTKYGAVAIHYPNDTIIDVAKVNGNVNYISALRYMVDDDMAMMEGKPSTLQHVPRFAKFPKRDPPPGVLGLKRDSTLSMLLERIIYGSHRRLEYDSIPTEVLKPDLSTLRPKTQNIIMAISEMMAKLMFEVREIESLNNVAVAIAIPGGLSGYSEYFEAAALEAGLAIIRLYSYRPKGFYRSDQVEACKNATKLDCNYDKWDFKSSDICNKMLSIQYDNKALVISWGTIDRYLKRLYLRKTFFHDLGHKDFLQSKQKREYWDVVKSSLANMIEPTQLNDVLILKISGDAESEPELLSFLKETFQDNPCLKEGRYLLPLQDRIFGEARDRAYSARFWMKDGYLGCLPNSACPGVEERGLKSEL